MTTIGNRAAALLALALSLAAASACSRAQARIAPDLPPLDVPVPPPRVVETNDPAMTQPGTLVEEPARNTVRPPAAPPRAGTPKPEPPPTEAPVVPAATSTPPPETKPTHTLQTTPPGREAEEAGRVRELLIRARENLRHVDYNRLSAGARTQYNQARQFAKLAEDSLLTRNLAFALTCADKAATLAAELAGR